MGDIIDGYQLFIKVAHTISTHYPGLMLDTSSENAVLKGEIKIIDEYGKFWESYNIEIHYREGFPYKFPAVYETSCKIPKIADWHMNEDGSCCIKVLPEELITCKNGITVREFIDQEVIPYFFNQTHRRVEGYYANGEYAHGIQGIYEFYSRVLETKEDVLGTVRMLLFIAQNKKPIRTANCFCGRDEKFRKCHRVAYERLSVIDKEYLNQHAQLIAKSYNLI